MKSIERKMMFAAALFIVIAWVTSCGGGGGGGSVGATAVAAETGATDGYVYAPLDGDGELSAAREADAPENAVPLSGASVTCEGKTTTSGDDGYFTLTGLPAGSRTLTISKPGYTTASVPVTIKKNVTVTSIPKGATIGAISPVKSGSISVTSSPSGATIILDGAKTAFITPNTLKNVLAGSHTVSVSLAGYDAPASKTTTVSAGLLTIAGFTLTKTNVTTTPVSSAKSYVVVDTNQAACYSNTVWTACPFAGAPFYGQDAQYKGAQPSYKDNGDGTITDNVTGLMWQSDPGSKKTHAQAVAGASTLRLAGYSDWRLPSIKELYSLIMFSGLDPSVLTTTDTSGLTPFINTKYFKFQYGDTSAGERIIDSQFASSNVYVGNGFDATTIFGVNFADGRIKGYGDPVFKPKTFFVLYVRGNKDYGKNSFTDNGNGTVTDAATGLTWQQADGGAGETWKDALAYCESLSLGGRDDWRLPNAKELQSIVDYTRAPSLTASAAIDPIFKSTLIINEGGQTDYPYYWTSTTHANAYSGDAAAYLSFGRALGYMNYSWVDVHGAGAQRSDPKSGSPSAYPYGRGPQGDAIRIYNFARCVRGTSGS